MSCCMYVVCATGSYNADIKSAFLAFVACCVFAAGLVVPGISWGPLGTALVAADYDAPL